MNDLKIVSTNDGILEVNLNSKMVRLNPIAKSCNKLVSDWLRLQGTQDLICEFQFSNAVMGNPITTIQGGRPSEQGTWVTKELAIAFMMWCSPSFAVGCLKKLDELFTTGETKIEHQAPATFKEALLLAIEQQEKIENLENQTKTLEIELDQSHEWLTIKKVASLNSLNWQNLDWRLLKTISEDFNCLPKKIFDANFPSGVNAYHVSVWENAYPNLKLDNNLLIEKKAEAIEPKEDIHLSITDVCEKLKVSKSFIYKRMQSGEIKFNKLSQRKTFFKLSDINDFLNKKKEY
jgi:excisionase family DNA binding protein